MFVSIMAHSWSSYGWSDARWTAAKWEEWYESFHSAPVNTVPAQFDWQASADHAAVADWSANEVVNVWPSATAPEETPPNSRPQPTQEVDEPTQPTQEAQPAAVAEAKASAAVAPAAAARNVQASESIATPAAKAAPLAAGLSAVAAGSKAGPTKAGPPLPTAKQLPVKAAPAAKAGVQAKALPLWLQDPPVVGKAPAAFA